MLNSSTDKLVRVLAIITMLLVIFASLKAASALVVPLILSLFFAIVLNPLIRLAERIRVPRVLAILLLMSCFVVIMLLLVAALSSTLNEFARTLPQYRSMLTQPLLDTRALLLTMGINISLDEMMHYIDPSIAVRLVSGAVGYFSNAMTAMFLLIMTVAFMLLEVPSLKQKGPLLFPVPSRAMAAIRHGLRSVTHYLVLKTVISLITGLTVWLMLWAMDIKFAFLWGTLAFALNYIPNIGSIIAAIPPIIQALLFNGLYPGLGVIAFYLAINLLFGNILEPRLMGRSLNLSTLVVFISLLFWGWLLGPVGMILSVPLTVVVKLLLEQLDDGKKLAILLSDNPQQH
ncbi:MULTISPECIES: AI-2E family transporter [Winslowiella]|uniref:AI-2E family transporter n=1 Tax=Winslowiella TaxID=2997349 RepID=UPI0028BD1898|nr:AI-2E family transporter [Winslowiella toletana]WNN42392.1 AI-2E family transporter [Winslowiella toletana]